MVWEYKTITFKGDQGTAMANDADVGMQLEFVLASGSGERFDAKNTPKHLTPILGVPIMIWTLKRIIKSFH